MTIVGLLFSADVISDAISRPWSRDSSALEFILSRSRSWSRDLKSKVSVFMLGGTITVICSTFKRVLCHQSELMQPVM